ncbi:hypothetical protein M8J76_002005 [Diaphorina citri]|nr:hypothetical protein M8J76_002005 [Diaphorina citri]
MVDTRVHLTDPTWGFLPGTLRRFPQKMTMKKNPTLRTRLAFPLHSSHWLPLLGNGSLPFLTLTRNLLLREFLARSLVVLLGIGLVWALLFKQFLLFANPQPTKPVLLLLDGHASHPKNLELIKMARDNNVVLLCFPTHCTHRMQPLDVSLMGPLSTYYEQEA